ncbi:MAG: O-antigen ligase [Candidatus Azotimanducaceae bacterium]|jgi:O-antigen ligase
MQAENVSMPNVQIVGAGGLALAYGLGITYVGSSVHLFGCMVLGLVGSGLMLLPALNSGGVWYRPLWFVLLYLLLQTFLISTSSLSEISFTLYWLWCSFVLITIGATQLGKNDWLKFFALFCLVGVFSAAWGLLDFFAHHQRADGPIVDPNAWAAMLNLFFFGLVSIYLTEVRYRMFALPVLAIFCLAMFSAYSRVGLAIFVLAGVYLGIVCAGVKAIRKPILLLASTALICFAIVHGSVSQSEATHHTEGYTVDASQHGWTQRFAMWRGALGIAETYPVFGSGLGTFVVQYPAYRELGDVRTLGYFAHNDYLQFLAEGGPALLGFLLLFVSWLVFRLIKHSLAVIRGNSAKVESLVLIVAMGTVLAHSLMNFALYQIQVQMLLGLLFARFIVLEESVQKIALSRSQKRLIQVASVLGGTTLMVVATLDALSFELVYERKPISTVLNIRQAPGIYFEAISQLATVRPGNSTNRLALATLYRSVFDKQSDERARSSLALIAALEYKAALAINPYHTGIRQYFAEFLEHNPELQLLPEINTTPEVLLREGVRLAPSHVENYINLVYFLERQSMMGEAYEILKSDAFKWVHIRRGNFEDNRNLIYRMLLKRAIARHDTEALENIIVSIDFLQLTPVEVESQQYQ